MSVSVKNPLSLENNNDLLQLIKQEINVEKVIFNKADQLSVELNTKLTAKLIKKREAREVIRLIQQKRKEAGCKLDQIVNITLPKWPKEYEKEIKQKTLIGKITKNKEIAIKK